MIKSWRDFYIILIKLQYSEEGFLRHFNVADLFHALLASFLLFEQFSLSADITAVAFRRYILSHLLYSFTGDNLCAYGCLNGDVKLLAWQKFLQLLAHTSAEVYRVVNVRKR